MIKTIIIGFDAFDPVIFEKLHSEGKTPNLSNILGKGGYSRFIVPDPPQSEVSWTSIASGTNPGGHGIFDFVLRNPNNYGSQVSLLPTKSNILGRQFIPPHSAPTIFDEAVSDGFPGISLWWPATFPARLQSPVWSIPGLGTPDIFGRLGVGIFYTTGDAPIENSKTRIGSLKKIGDGEFQGELEGPVKTTLTGGKQTNTNFKLSINDGETGDLVIGRKNYSLTFGEWSSFIELTFKVGFGLSIKAVTRALLTKTQQGASIYFLPLQIHPLRSPWPYGTPKRLLNDLWKEIGPYLTLGWPQDTTGLEEGYINDVQFLNLCGQICDYRERAFSRMIESFDEGIIACVFDSLDRVQHMFLRDRPDIIESWYLKLDALFGRLYKKILENPKTKYARILVVSDHGFGEFNYKVNLNRWLQNYGYLVTNKPGETGSLNLADWDKSQLYAVGLNSMYLNMTGREVQGIVSPEKKPELIHELSKRILDWKGPDGRKVVKKVMTSDDIFQGPYTLFGPDLIIGYSPGYRASAQTGLGEWNEEEIEPNTDHWGADHCFAADTVPGVIFSNQGLHDLSSPSYEDFPMLAINKAIDIQSTNVKPQFSDEDQDKVNERLKELGYL